MGREVWDYYAWNPYSDSDTIPNNDHIPLFQIEEDFDQMNEGILVLTDKIGVIEKWLASLYTSLIIEHNDVDPSLFEGLGFRLGYLVQRRGMYARFSTFLVALRKKRLD